MLPCDPVSGSAQKRLILVIKDDINYPMDGLDKILVGDMSVQTCHIRCNHLGAVCPWYVGEPYSQSMPDLPEEPRRPDRVALLNCANGFRRIQ